MNAFNIVTGIVNSLIDSKAEDVTKNIVSEAIKKHDLNQILDQYDKSFLEKYDTLGRGQWPISKKEKGHGRSKRNHPGH